MTIRSKYPRRYKLVAVVTRVGSSLIPYGHKGWRHSKLYTPKLIQVKRDKS